MALKKKLKQIRLKLWEKNPFCFVCGQKIEEYSECTLEHVVPKSLGGTDEEINLSVSHKHCNQLRKNTRCRLVWQNPELVRRLKWMRTPAEIMKAWKNKSFIPKEDI